MCSRINVSDPFLGAIRQVLLHEWDPVGVGDDPRAHDEYDAYVLSVARLIDVGADRFRLAEHLHHLETISMGLLGRRDRAQRVAATLHALAADRVR